MASFNPNRLVNRDPSKLQAQEGYSPQLYRLSTKPPGETYQRQEDGSYELVVLPDNFNTHGSVFYIPGNNEGDYYAQLYVYIDPPDNELMTQYTWRPWKKVDLNWPKIDPDTGKYHDQHSLRYSGFAE